jgi:hypothetical protein
MIRLPVTRLVRGVLFLIVEVVSNVTPRDHVGECDGLRNIIAYPARDFQVRIGKIDQPSGKSGIEALPSLVHERQTLTPGRLKLRAGVVIALITRDRRAYF